MKLNFVTAKGGAGGSTVACAYAIMQSTLGWDVDLVDYSFQRDIPGILGLPDVPETIDVNDRLRLVYGEPSYDRLIVADYGTMTADRLNLAVQSGDIDPAKTFLVVRADYLHLRAASRLQHQLNIVLVQEPDRVLGVKDIENVLGPVQAVVKHTPVVQRTLDAGMLSSRPPKEFADLSGIAHYPIHK